MWTRSTNLCNFVGVPFTRVFCNFVVDSCVLEVDPEITGVVLHISTRSLFHHPTRVRVCSFVLSGRINLFSFYLFFEISVIHIVIIVLGWGCQEERLQAVFVCFLKPIRARPVSKRSWGRNRIWSGYENSCLYIRLPFQRADIVILFEKNF
jgi:hypothetical protein